MFLAVTTLLWAAAYKANLWPHTLFPSPGEVKDALLAGFRDRSFPNSIMASLQRMTVGYALSLLVGLPLGVFIAHFEWARQTVGQMVLGLQALPSICWLPLAALWFGLTERAVLFVVVMGSLFSITSATAAGLNTIAPSLVSAGQTLGARGFTLYRKVMLPAALPPILTGMKLGWTFAWRSLMAGELIYHSVGLGRILQGGRDRGNMGEIIAAMLVIIAIGLLVEGLLFRPLESRIRRRYGLAGA